jgi:hypothetical protein
METYAFASLAHIRILLVPVGLIPKALFESYTAEIRSFTTLKLAEIPSDTKDGGGSVLIFYVVRIFFNYLQLLAFCLIHCRLDIYMLAFLRTRHLRLMAPFPSSDHPISLWLSYVLVHALRRIH